MGIGDKVLDEGWIEGWFLLRQLSPSCVYTVYNVRKSMPQKGAEHFSKIIFLGAVRRRRTTNPLAKEPTKRANTLETKGHTDLRH